MNPGNALGLGWNARLCSGGMLILFGRNARLCLGGMSVLVLGVLTFFSLLGGMPGGFGDCVVRFFFFFFFLIIFFCLLLGVFL